MYIGRNGVVCYDIKESESFDVTRGLVAFPSPAFEQVGFHHFAVVSTELSEAEQFLDGYCSRVATDAARVNGM